MPPILSFIGWHNSGKTTLACRVVAHLTARGYGIGVIKSSKESGLAPDQPGTDTDLYRRAGAAAVALVTPDQLVFRSNPPELGLRSLAERHFPAMDLVIAEGFKHAAGIAKIEVNREESGPLLRDQVAGVIAVATARTDLAGVIFRLDQSHDIADFIIQRFLRLRSAPAEISLNLDGQDLAVPDPLRHRLLALGRELEALRPEQGQNLELRIRIGTQRP